MERTAELMAQVAPLWGVLPEKAYTAGLFHDLARDLSQEEILRFCREAGTVPELWEEKRPLLLHGEAGAYLLRKEGLVDDEEILKAIASHVTARAPMTPLARLLYVADKGEPGRRWKEGRLLLKLAGADPQKAFEKALSVVIAFLAGEGRFIHPATISAYNRALDPQAEEIRRDCPYCGRWRNRPAVVDGIVLNSAGDILLIRRGREPFRGDWALPGGFMDWGETARDAVIREVREETGLIFKEPHFLAVFDSPGRDPHRGTVSLAYYGYAAGEELLRPGDDACDGGWFPLSSLPPLAFDHGRILSLFLEKSRL
jgi:8-oxo-dGTP diphosphatase